MPQNNMTCLLERSLEKKRLAHAYLFSGDAMEELEIMARVLARALNCSSPRSADHPALGFCGQCDSCHRIERDAHPDVLWVRPESKSRVITIDQMRELMHSIQLKPTTARYKFGIIAAADRLNPQAGNAFLKTLEEPPADSILILLTTEPQRILETVLSRCLRLGFGGEGMQAHAQHASWLAGISELAARSGGGLMARYQLLGLISSRLASQKAEIEKTLTERSPLEQYEDLDPQTREKLEEELTAAIESEYRHQRADVLGALHWWLRDVWLQTLRVGAQMLCFPDLKAAAHTVATRISPADAMRNLEEMDLLLRLLNSNVQEALALEVALLKLKL
jgi:DNA polymerase-3 subunit delta'